jgi:shikimate kinase
LTNSFKILFLVGMPGVGKSYYGKLAATELGMKFYDLDDEIVKLQKMSIADIFSSKGESEFRKIEFETLNAIINQCDSDAIIATGGGTPCFNNAMLNMNKIGITIWLDAEIEDLFANLKADNTLRPLFGDTTSDQMRTKLSEMYALRSEFYGQSRGKVSVYRGLSPDLFTKRLQLSTFAK